MRQSEVALDNIRSVGLQLEARVDAAGHARPTGTSSFRRIRLSDVVYEYKSRNGEIQFRLGPISLEIHRGETLFIAGGNGSGKTSLLKLLCGLYAPTQGSIHVDSHCVESDGAASYRQLFSAVFQNCFVIKKLPKLTDLCVLRQATAYLSDFGLAPKVRIAGDRFVCDELSTGQRKRLALIVALLENKALCLLDEWAADQDPHFKEYFYATILSRMKSDGRTVVVVSHDAQYYRAADRVLVVREGMLNADHEKHHPRELEAFR
jgi:putative ATP-binding cassette transporter